MWSISTHQLPTAKEFINTALWDELKVHSQRFLKREDEGDFSHSSLEGMS